MYGHVCKETHRTPAGLLAMARASSLAAASWRWSCARWCPWPIRRRSPTSSTPLPSTSDPRTVIGQYPTLSCIPLVLFDARARKSKFQGHCSSKLVMVGCCSKLVMVGCCSDRIIGCRAKRVMAGCCSELLVCFFLSDVVPNS